MLKADIARLTALASDDEAVRVAAADALAALPRHHFDDHDVDADRLPPDWLEAMAAGWRATSSDVVREWIAQAVALARPWPCKPIEPLVPDFLAFDGPYLRDVVPFVVAYASGRPGVKERVLALRRHRNREVRAAVALTLWGWLKSGVFDYATEGAVAREMMLDPDDLVRDYAVQIAEKTDQLGVADVEVLLDVVNMDNRNARSRARRLIEKLAATLPGCSPEHFAPRVPLLRTDGLYYANVTELDHAGRWMTLRCLRFFADGTVQAFGTDEAPIDLADTLPHRTQDGGRGTVRKEGAQLSFTIESAAGAEDCAGVVDGSEIRLTRTDRATGRETPARYEFGAVDWGAPPPRARPAKKPRGKEPVPLPFERVRPDSLIMSDAAVWYLRMVARLAIFVDAIDNDEQRFERAWFLKNELREAAAKSLFDSSLKRDFFDRMPLPAAADMLQAVGGDSPGRHARALRVLTTVTDFERAPFIGQLMEEVGTTYDGAEGRFVLAEQGWQRA